MARRGPKFTIPLPVNGVHKELNPLTAGLSTLVDGENFVFRNGKFHTRDGLTQLGFTGTIVNMLTVEGADFSNKLGYTTSVADADIVPASEYISPVVGSFYLKSSFGSSDIMTWDAVSCSSGVDYTGSVWVNLNAPESSANVFSLTLRFYDSGGSLLSDVAGGACCQLINDAAVLYYVGEGPGYAHLWVRFDITKEAPTSSVTVKMELKTDSFPSADGIRIRAVDAAQLEQASDSSAWVPGGNVPMVGTLANRPMGFYQYDKVDSSGSDKDKIVAATTAGMYLYDQTGSNTWQPLTGPALNGSMDNPVSMRAYDAGGNTYVMMVNGGGPLISWDGDPSNPYVQETAAPALPKCVAVSGARVLIGNVTYGGTQEPDMVAYSNVLNKGAWGSLDFIRLADTSGEIVAMLEMGSLMTVVYKTDSIYSLVVQGGLYPFRPQLVATSVPGPASVNSVAAVNRGLHVFLGRNGGVYMFDGSAVRSLGDHIRTYISSTVDFDLIGRSWVEYDSHRDEIFVFYPTKSTGLMNRGVMISMSAGYPVWPLRWDTNDGVNREFSAGIQAYVPLAMTFSQMTEPWSAYNKTFQQFKHATRKFILGRTDGAVYIMEGDLDVDVSIPAFFQTGVDTIGGDITKGKIIKEVDVFIDQTYGPQLAQLDLLESERGEAPVVPNSKVLDLHANGRKIAQFRRTVNTMGLRFIVTADEKIYWNGASVAIRERGFR